MPVRLRWRGAVRAGTAAAARTLLAGSAVAACAAMAVVPAPWAAASQRSAGAAAAVPHICHAWVHDGQRRTKLAKRLSRDISVALRGRAGTYAVRVQDPHLGIGCGLNTGRHFDSASAVKATILAALLRKADIQHRSLTAQEKSLARLMITQSDNTAATTLWNDVGRYRLQRFLDLAGMSQTVLGPTGYWGLTQITAHDESLLLWLLLDPNSVLTTANRRYELSLMAHVIASQRFGVPAGAPAGFTVHVKNGWLPVPSAASPWYVNSIGCFTRGDGVKDYSIVVLTHQSAAHPAMAYGVTTIEDVAVVVHRDLNAGTPAAVPRSAPRASWTVPDEPLPPASVAARAG
jgi:Beta-lactamase enzyme family